MKHALILAACLGLAAVAIATAPADATVVRKKSSDSSGATSGGAAGGVDVVPAGKRVRVQCWQDGHKIIDEEDLAVVSLSIASQMNGLRFRRNGGTDSTVSVVTQSRTACLLAPDEGKSRDRD
ncbi:hypothetical protein J2848_003579 [Azospirillum lipoferum]|uniref:Uncharacterized protein n=1 Tax=Azospirillum lipoferum TaxID=193 RepID=A0A5A9GLB7_AZOLI|nr:MULTISPECIES: hypothetical protein [Azospirillum]KAA0595226.1 hypothetical protein FZ942_16420 [Azospirillum lipoferum]MCP1611901.1 hypothetical protein [Azospirillum lipoferum]MDW5533340.1 hypothetical protein [Azospirillum sp. NL1]